MPSTCARSTSASSAAIGTPAARSATIAASRSSPQVRIFAPKYRRAVQREPTVADVVAARRVVDRYLPRAPLERSPLLSADLGADVHLKIETFKPTRTFKVRGALNKIASLDAAARRRGVVAASAGSHAQGVAFAAAALGAPATVVMPNGVSEMIVRVCRAYGAEVRLEGSVYDDTLALAHRIEREEGKTFVHPYADPLIVAGQGTIGLEILDDLVTVNDDALEDATYEYLDRLSLLVEPSGAAPLAAVRAGRADVRGRTVVLVVSGGNATPALVARIAGERGPHGLAGKAGVR